MITTVETYKGVPIHDYSEPGNRFYYISGEFWLNDTESTYDAEAHIIAEATKRGAKNIQPDSESSCFFFNGFHLDDMRIVIDVLDDEGRIDTKPTEPIGSPSKGLYPSVTVNETEDILAILDRAKKEKPAGYTDLFADWIREQINAQ